MARLPSNNHAPSRSRLAAPLSSFIGRQEEIASVVDHLQREGVRLVTLTGPGGVGKTRLALRVVEQLAGAFEDGTAEVSLAPVADPSLVLSAIAQVLGVRGDVGRPIADALADELVGRELLLLLDNFEHVIDAGRDVAALLAACPRLKVLVTSRTVLHLSGEHDLAVGPLRLPDEPKRGSLVSVAASPAVQLFVQRASAARSGFALTDENATTVVEICRRVDGLPLAIELAAARIAHLPAQALLERLEPGLPLLTGGARDQPARQQTMRNTIAWSYDLLAPDEQALFRRLGVFVGGFTLDAAEAITRGAETDILVGISSLIDKSLLRQEDQGGSQPRYLMLETVREFALEQLAASGEESQARERHAAYFANLAAADVLGEWVGFGVGIDQDVAIELPNVQAAATWALQSKRADLAWQLGSATQPFFHAQVNVAAALQLMDATPGPAEGQDLEAYADALWVVATLAILRDLDEANELAEESLSVARSLGDAYRTARALNMLNATAEWKGDHLLSAERCAEGLSVLSDLGNEPRVDGLRALLRCNLADSHVMRGNLEEATLLAENSLAWWREHGPA